MIPIDFSDIKVLDDKIIYSDDGRVLVYLNEVWAIGYKKSSFLHWLTMKHDWMAMGILYIGRKEAKNVKDLIPIVMPYAAVKGLPKPWAKKIEFYEFGGDIKIKRIE